MQGSNSPKHPKRITYRAHHFLCTLGFEGKGYSPEFIENFQSIVDQLHPDQEIQQVGEADSICEPCPQRRGRSCTERDKIESLDRNHREVHGIQDGQVVTWGEVKRVLAEKVSMEDFHRMCAPCGWKKLGVCEKALKTLKSKFVFFLFVLVGSGFGQIALAANGAEKKLGLPVYTGAIVYDADGQLGTYIDDVFEKLFRAKKDRRAIKLKQALDLFHKGQYKGAIRKTTSVLKDTLFGERAHSLKARSHLRYARELIEKNQSSQAAAWHADQAIKTFQKIQREYPDSPINKHMNDHIAQAELAIAGAHFIQKNYKQAMKTYENAFFRLSHKKRIIARATPKDLDRFSGLCKKKKNVSEGCQYWVKRLLDFYPEGSKETQIVKEKIDWSSEIEKIPLPEVDYQTQRYKSNDKDIVAFDEAMKEVWEDDFDDAADLFREFLKEYPKSHHRLRAKFWLARSLQQDGEEEEASQIYEELLREAPMSYYGMVAGYMSGKKMETYVDAVVPRVLDRDPHLNPYQLKRLERGEKLFAVGAVELAARDLTSLQPNRSYTNEFLFYLAALQSKVGNYLTSFRTLNQLIDRGYKGMNTSYAMKLIFPKVEEELIDKIAQDQQLDSILVMSLIKQESAFTPDIVSWAGAQGYMQLMPFTAVEVDAELPLNQVMNKESNIRLGTTYLAGLLRRFEGNIVYSLAGYNAGPHRVARWKKEAKKDLTLFEFIEFIPFKETRGYVSSIMRNYFWYGYRYHGKRLSSLDYFWGVSGPTEVPKVLRNDPERSPVNREPKAGT